MNSIFKRKIHGHRLRAIEFNPLNSDLVVISGDYGNVFLFSVKSGELVWENDEMDDIIGCIRFSKDGKHVAAGGLDQKLMVLDAEDGKSCFRMDLIDIACSLSFRNDNKIVVGLTDDVNGRVLLVNWKSNMTEKSIQASDDSIYALAILPLCDDMVLMGDFGGCIKLMNMKEEKVIRKYESHTKSVTLLQFDEEGNKFVSASWDNTARLYFTDQPNAITKFEGHASSVRFASLLHNGEIVLTASSDGEIKLWNAESGKCIMTVEANGNVWRGAMSKDEKVLAIGYTNGFVEVFSCPPRPVYSIHKKFLISWR